MKTENENESRSPAAKDQAGVTDSTKLLSRRQVAERWGVCTHTLARRKDLTPIRFNRRLLRYRLSDVQALEK